MSNRDKIERRKFIKKSSSVAVGTAILGTTATDTVVGQKVGGGGGGDESPSDPAVLSTTNEIQAGDYSGAITLTTRYNGSYEVGTGGYEHAFIVGGAKSVCLNGGKYDAIVEDYATVDNKNPTRDSIVTAINYESDSKWCNATSDNGEPADTVIPEMMADVIETAVGELTGTLGIFLAAADLIESLQNSNDGPQSDTWALGWNYDSSPDAIASACTNSIRYSIHTDQLGDYIEVENIQKSNIPPLNTSGSYPSANQIWSAYTDGDDLSGSSISTTSKSTSQSGELLSVDDYIDRGGNVRDDLSRQLEKHEVPEFINKRYGDVPVRKFHLPFTVEESTS